MERRQTDSADTQDESRKRLALPLPERCPQCEVAGRIRVQQLIQGDSVLLSWFCTECESEWAIRDGEPRFVERRQGRTDRRARPRTDRRKRQAE